MARGRRDIDGPNLVDVHVGQRVGHLRKARGLSQSQLGEQLQVSFQQVQKYEKGANRISASVLWHIAQHLNVSVAHFFEGLTPVAPGVAESDTVAFVHDFPRTPQSGEIARLTPQLSVAGQKAVLNQVKYLIAAEREPG